MTACAKYGVCIMQRLKRRSSIGTTVVSPTAVALALRGPAVDERELAEDAAFADGLDLAGSVVDEHRSFADDVEAVGRIARAEDNFARRDLLGVRFVAEHPEVVVTHADDPNLENSCGEGRYPDRNIRRSA
jgi:hypothetical protein